MNKEKILAIVGITPGKFPTIGQVLIELQGLKFNMYSSICQSP
jgi:hypothetical protein